MFNFIPSRVNDFWYGGGARSNRYPSGKFTGLMGRKKSVCGWWRHRS